MSDFKIIIIVAVGVLWFACGMFFAIVDICEKGITTPKGYYDYDGYNWFGCWSIFILRTIIAFPFYILFSLAFLIKGFIEWLFTVGRKDDDD